MIKNKLGITAYLLNDFCHRWKISELALFGSVIRDDYNKDSDIDVLVTFLPDVIWSLLDHVKMVQELSELFGRRVDLISKRAISMNNNWIIREEILNSAETIYVA